MRGGGGGGGLNFCINMFNISLVLEMKMFPSDENGKFQKFMCGKL